MPSENTTKMTKPLPPKRKKGKQNIIIITGKPARRKMRQSPSKHQQKMHDARQEQRKTQKSLRRSSKQTLEVTLSGVAGVFLRQSVRDSMQEVFQWMSDDRLPNHPMDKTLLRALEQNDMAAFERTLKKNLKEINAEKIRHDMNLAKRKNYLEIMSAILEKSSERC